jgi:cobalamin biosynthesis protein CbiG
LRLAAVPTNGLAAVATIESRSDEPAILHAAAFLRVPLHVYSAARLEEETPRLLNPSDLVFAHVGCHGVAEAAALADAGPGSKLALPKTKSGFATAAVARAFSGYMSPAGDMSAPRRS